MRTIEYIPYSEGESNLAIIITPIDDIIEELNDKEYKKIYLYPFLLVAGDHALNDIASDEEDSINL